MNPGRTAKNKFLLYGKKKDIIKGQMGKKQMKKSNMSNKKSWLQRRVRLAHKDTQTIA